MEEKEKEEEKGASQVSRRDFLKDAGLLIGGAAVGAAAGAGITYAVAPAKEVIKEVPVIKEVIKEVSVTGVLEPASEPEETVVRGISFAEAGFPVAVDYKNGKIVRIRPFHYDWKYKPEEFTRFKVEARGKVFEIPLKAYPNPLHIVYKKRVYSPNRVRYPLKRVDWEPGGDPAKINPQNRGKSKFKRISWDEAATIISSEIKRIQAKYGPYGILCSTRGHQQVKTLHGASNKHKMLLQYLGGYTNQLSNPDSWEGWYWGAMHMWGMVASMANGVMSPTTNVFKDVSEHTEMIVFQGGDWETTDWMSGGRGLSRAAYWFTELGIKQVYISPDLNYAAAVHADKWIPVLPNTDAALEFAIAYIWMTEGTYDKAYIDTHSVGFDKFQAYIMGKEDGVPKTPKWASPLCGVPVWTIKALAREWASKVTATGHFLGGSFMRGPYGHEPARGEVCLLAMQGLGKPGVHQIAWRAGLATAMPPTRTSVAGAQPPLKAITAKEQTLTMLHMSRGILNPPQSWYGLGPQVGTLVEKQFIKNTYPAPKEDGGTEIHMYWVCCPCMTVCWNGGNTLIKAFRSPKLECIVAQQPWLEDDSLYADILLPITTVIEDEDLMRCPQENEILYLQEKSIEPIGESKSDYHAVGEIAKKMGVYDKYTGGKTDEEWLKSGWEKSGVSDLVSWEKLKENQYYVVPTRVDVTKEPAGLAKFYQDPKNNPLETPTGKLEFYSQKLADNFPDDNERPPSPKWVVGGPGWTHDESLWGERAKKYTLLLITNHPRWRLHAQHDDVPWLREIPSCKVKGPDGYMYEAVWIHPTDAAKRGIKSGDIVKLYNERGAVLGGAIVWEKIIPGAVYQDHGARLDEIIPGELDRGGSNNLICPVNTMSKNAEGEATSGYLVEVEKVTGNQMDEWRKNYPDAFARDYDAAYGLKFDAWIEGGT